MKDWKEIKALPEYLQPKILSAVAYINSAAPNMSKSVERINTLSKHLSDKEKEATIVEDMKNNPHRDNHMD